MKLGAGLKIKGAGLRTVVEADVGSSRKLEGDLVQGALRTIDLEWLSTLSALDGSLAVL